MQQKGIFTTFAKSISVKIECKKSADNAIYLNEQNSYNLGKAFPFIYLLDIEL